MPSEDSSRRSADSNRDEPCAFIGRALEYRPIWYELGASLHDTFFPQKLPPLELTSTPITVPDRLAAKTNPWAVGTSTIINGILVALLVFVGMHKIISPGPRPAPSSKFTLSDLPFFAPQKERVSGGGGGGGTDDSVDPIRGRLPRIEQSPLTPPQVPLLDPKLSIEPAIAVPLDVKLPDNPALPNVGAHASANVTLLSNGPGAHGGMEIGTDGGLGPGRGIGVGPGDRQGVGTGPYVPGEGGVTEPIPVVTPEAEFSDEARRAKFQGLCMISLIVDAHGNPVNPRVVRRLGMGLDEKALDAVGRYRFKPAMKQGRPVPVLITVAVDFRLY